MLVNDTNINSLENGEYISVDFRYRFKKLKVALVESLSSRTHNKPTNEYLVQIEFIWFGWIISAQNLRRIYFRRKNGRESRNLRIASKILLK